MPITFKNYIAITIHGLILNTLLLGVIGVDLSPRLGDTADGLERESPSGVQGRSPGRRSGLVVNIKVKFAFR